MDKEDVLQARMAYIWASDYRNQNTAAVLAGHCIKTFGELADMTPARLFEFGLMQDEIYGVSQLLAKRGLLLSKDDHDVLC